MSSDDQIICQNFVVVLNISQLALPSNMPQSLVARLGVLAHQIGHLHGWQPPLPLQGVGGHTGPGLKGHQVSQRAANIRGQGWSEAGLSATDVGLCTRGPEGRGRGTLCVVDGRNFRRHRTEGSLAETLISGRMGE